MKKFKAIIRLTFKIAALFMIIVCGYYGAKYLLFGNNIHDGIKCLIFGMIGSWDDIIDIKGKLFKIN